MFVIMGVTLFTSRIVIRTLGIDDYGIYNIVGGIVILFSFINISLRSAIQRFISYDLGQHDIEEVHKVINLSLLGILIISIICTIISETIGIWFVNNKLDIPENRMYAANWVYQLSVLTFILNLLQTPYQATIISYEKMSFFTWYSVAEVFMKLGVAAFIFYCGESKLITYAILMLAVNVISLILTAGYCHKILKVPIRRYHDKKKFFAIMSFSGWGMVNSSTVIIAQQGGNILLNFFGGVVANGAYGIANQVSAAVNQFVSNFQNAFNPQIIKSFASNEHNEMFRLIVCSGKISFYLLLIITIPFFVNCGEILQLWLGEEPMYATGFCNLMLIYFLVDASQAPLWMLINASGKVKIYQIWSGTITLCNIPISALILYNGGSIYWIFGIRVLLNCICAIIRPLYVKHLISDFSLRQYFLGCVWPIIKVGLLVIGMIAFIYTAEIQRTFLCIAICTMITVVIIWKIGLLKTERNTLSKMAIKLLRNGKTS